MSWQRILRFARQRQVPVIVTDESGEDPMILLSLDQLEQALDGNIGPDLPPPPPAPRTTTPSFVPDITFPAEPESTQVLPLEPEVTSSVPEGGFTPEMVVESVMIEERPVPVQEEEKTIFLPNESFKTDGLVGVSSQPEPEIITPHMPPIAQELAIVKPEPESPVSAEEPSNASNLSLEERFFLDF